MSNTRKLEKVKEQSSPSLDRSSKRVSGEPVPRRARNLITELLLGVVLSYPHIGFLGLGKIVIRRDYMTMETVRIISGGGSGYEPAFAGFVGKGMLTAAVHGEIFKSPSSTEILNTIREIAIKAGSNILVLIPQEPGASLNFGLAVERAKNDGIDVRMLIVKDDVERRNGLSGFLLLLKIAGAMAQAGNKMNDIYETCKELMKYLNSAVCQFKNCGIPNTGDCTCVTPEIRGKDALKRCEQVIVEDACNKFMEEIKSTDMKHVLSIDRSFPTVVLINNLGHAARMEELLFVNGILRKMFESRYIVARLYCGKYMSSLQQVGFSFSVLRLPNPKFLDFLDAPTSAPAWIPATTSLIKPELGIKIVPKLKIAPTVSAKGPKLPATTGNIIQMVVQFACEAIVSCEKQINLMDTEGGDGDTGLSMSRGAKAIKKSLVADPSKTVYPYSMLTEFSKIVEQNMGGTLGCLYSIFFEASAQTFTEMKELDHVSCNDWVNALTAGNTALSKYSSSKVGECTVIDPLNACAMSMQAALICGASCLDALQSGVSAAEDSAKIKKPGRKQPDPGSYAVGLWIRAIYEGIKLKIDV